MVLNVEIIQEQKQNRIENLLMSKGNIFCCTKNTEISRCQSILVYRNCYPTELYYFERIKNRVFS